ncbi:MAG TPA: hypothetical protein VG387_15030 [Rhizomicrobium sp.]|jgi:hypothetical protein|nr:hypothetical protein [Rhizomicrobium sp.]
MDYRLGIVALAALLLTGCAEGDWAHLTRYDSPLGDPTGNVPPMPMPMPEQPVTPVSYRSNPLPETRSPSYCARAADERAVEAEYQDFDDTIRKAIHDKTYADCMAWRR